MNSDLNPNRFGIDMIALNNKNCATIIYGHLGFRHLHLPVRIKGRVLEAALLHGLAFNIGSEVGAQNRIFPRL